MKRKIVSILLISSLVISLQAQSFDKKNVAVCSFNVNINPNLGITPNREIADHIYRGVNAVLLDSAGIQLKNIDFLKDKITYFLGYPVGNAKNAAKSKLCSNYVKIVVDVSPDGIFSTNNSSFSVSGVGKEKKKVNARIKVAINLIIYDEKGEKLKEINAKSISKEKIVVDSESLSIGDFSFVEKKKNGKNFETFQEILFQAAIELAKKSN